MADIAKIVVAAAPYAIDRPFDYKIPPALAGQVQPGMRCAVPFGGGNRTSSGIVLSVGAGADSPKLKSILALLDEEPLLGGSFIPLALWIREQYFCTVYDAFRVMLPAGLWYSLEDRWSVSPEVSREAAYEAAGRSAAAAKLLDMLYATGGSELGDIRIAFGEANPLPVIRSLREKGILVQETSTQRGIGDKTELVAEMKLSAQEIMAAVELRKKRAPMQYAAAEALCTVGRVSAKELCYFTGASLQTLRALEEQGLITLTRNVVYRRPPIPETADAAPIVLNREQQIAYEGVLAELRQPRPRTALLYGITGSGKTQVYLQLIHTLLARGKNALILVPEIALTPQVMRIFTSHFGKQVAILHSSLSPGQRCDEWRRCRRGDARVAVGTRSAVFAPMQNLGIIILDEEQEPTYKSEQNPRYHARDVARYRCLKEGAMLLLGSATPSVESMYHAKAGDYLLFTLSKRYNEKPLPPVTIVDMKKELRMGNLKAISGPLQAKLEEAMVRGEQSILFLNRRGAYKMATCGECGDVPSCPHCSVHLTYHSANQRLMCHYCGYSEPLPKQCPHCGGAWVFSGTGTQQLEEELKETFPNAEVLRMDADTVSATHTHEAILEKFRRQNIPILIGTQMVAKGLDFENVTLVGAVSADQSLYSSSVRAGERTFSLLTQVCGRAGRGGKAGGAVIQTFTPENNVIQCAARQDYDAFYEQEIALRRMRDFPPFNDFFVFSISGENEDAVQKTCIHLRDSLGAILRQPQYANFPYRLLGPAPEPIAKVNNRYRYRLILNTRNQKEIRRLVASLLQQAQADRANRGVSVFADINPLD